MVQGEWLRFVQWLPANQRLLGATTDLSDFLFGADRGALSRACDRLRELQSGRCFYCESTLADAADVDHFIPWSRYPRDLVHNLVAAHRKCNANKSDLLAAEPYRRRWVEWVDRRDADLGEIGRGSGLIVDRPTALSIADWSYAHARHIGAEVWLGGSDYAPIEPGGRARSADHPRFHLGADLYLDSRNSRYSIARLYFFTRDRSFSVGFAILDRSVLSCKVCELHLPRQRIWCEPRNERVIILILVALRQRAHRRNDFRYC